MTLKINYLSFEVPFITTSVNFGFLVCEIIIAVPCTFVGRLDIKIIKCTKTSYLESSMCSITFLYDVFMFLCLRVQKEEWA